MKKQKFNPFENLILNEYEQEIEDSLGKKVYLNDPDFKETKKMLEEAAKNHIQLRQSKSITLRIKQDDLIKLKAKAKRAKIAYQTLINLLINKYAEGKLKLTV